MAEFSTFEKTGLFPIDKKQCISDKDQKSLRIWKDRVRRYFSKIDQEALDYRVNDDDTGVKVLEDDGTIFEITIDKGTSVATARLCPNDEPWSFEY
jgi:hypothetical protein